MEKPEADPVKKLMNGMRVTSRCRFNASVRLKRLSAYSFFTTTFLSLGLIFIPLVQNADVPLHFQIKVLNLMQVFFAVAVLVYSVVNATARYDVRALALNECGDKLKDLIRSLRVAQSQTGGGTIDLAPYHEKYRDVLGESENHSRLDFLVVTLEMPGDYRITGMLRAYYKLKIQLFYLIPFVLPTLMMVVESIFILDALGISDELPKFLGGDPLAAL